MMVVCMWGQFMLGMLSWRPIGNTVLPAFWAMISAESLYFLSYTFMFVGMATHAYYALPLPDNWPMDEAEHLNRFWVSFLRMYRMNVLGDFDFFELENVNTRLEPM